MVPLASRGGSIGLGEMELHQLQATGMKNCLEEFCVRSDLCTVDVCNRCNCITIICSCTMDTRRRSGTYTVLLPLSSIKLILATRVCSSMNVELVAQIN